MSHDKDPGKIICSCHVVTVAASSDVSNMLKLARQWGNIKMCFLLTASLKLVI